LTRKRIPPLSHNQLFFSRQPTSLLFDLESQSSKRAKMIQYLVLYRAYTVTLNPAMQGFRNQVWGSRNGWTSEAIDSESPGPSTPCQLLKTLCIVVQKAGHARPSGAPPNGSLSGAAHPRGTQEYKTSLSSCPRMLNLLIRLIRSDLIQPYVEKNSVLSEHIAYRLVPESNRVSPNPFKPQY
jgi:hypothetical protein